MSDHVRFELLIDMRLLIIITFLWMSCNADKTHEAGQDIPAISANDENTLRHLKTVLWPQAYQNQDTVLLDQILGEDFQLIDAAGNWSDKKAQIKWISENHWNPDSFYYDIIRLDILPNGSAMLCGTGHRYNDSLYTKYQSSNVMVKRNGQWKAISSHVSGVETSTIHSQ